MICGLGHIIAGGMVNKQAKIYTVSQINTVIKAVLENNLPGQLSITGEVTGWKIHQSGHCYFALKDENAQLPCVMWRNSVSKLKFAVENGMAVVATGFVDVYTAGGKYQFYVDSLEPAGVGALQLAFEQMVKKLEAEGLFEERYKKPLPAYPERIGIVTSETGAAVHDIADSIGDRWPVARLVLYPVPVQGEGAAEKIAAAIKDVNRRNKELKLDVLIVGRGGGSPEDLWAFNEEVLARAIFASKIPVISAVGHEVDVTIADLVADMRAATPTKAGVIAVPDVKKVLSDLENYQSSMNNNITLCLNSRQQQLDEETGNVVDAVREFLAERREWLYKSYEQVTKIEPHRLLGRKMVSLGELKNSINSAMQAMINKSLLKVTARQNRLAGLDPRSVLNRGYSITTNRRTGKVVAKPEDVRVGDFVITELARKKMIESQVIKKQNKDQRN